MLHSWVDDDSGDDDDDSGGGRDDIHSLWSPVCDEASYFLCGLM